MTESRVPLLIRIPAGLKQKLAELAKSERRSLNQQIEFLLDRSLHKELKDQGRGSSLPKGSGRRRR